MILIGPHQCNDSKTQKKTRRFGGKTLEMIIVTHETRTSTCICDMRNMYAVIVLSINYNSFKLWLFQVFKFGSAVVVTFRDVWHFWSLGALTSTRLEFDTTVWLKDSQKENSAGVKIQHSRKGVWKGLESSSGKIAVTGVSRKKRA